MGNLESNGAPDGLRPNSTDNWNTYWAIVVAPKGTAKFAGKESLKGKKVLCCSLASSGEFFVRAQYKGAKPDCQILKAKSHGAAISALARGVADLAVVKNRVWDSIKKDPRAKGSLEKLEVIGRHAGENPDGTLIVAKTLKADLVNKVKTALLVVEADKSPEAAKLRKSLNIDRYIPTTVEDFKFTIPMLKDAGVDAGFKFTY